MKKVLKWFLLLMVCLVVAYTMFAAVVNWRGKHAWRAYQREREAKGDSFDWTSVKPPPVPDAENFAAIPGIAELFTKTIPRPKTLDLISVPDCKEPYGDWQVGSTENLAAWRTCFTNDDLLVALKRYEPTIGEISTALQQRPKCRFPVRYEEHVNAVFPNPTAFVRLSSIYRLRALAELSEGRSDAAFEDVRLCLRLADTIKNEPSVWFFQWRSTILNRGVIHPVWEGLATHRWNDRQLTALQAELAGIDGLSEGTRAIQGERLADYDIVRWSINKRRGRIGWMSYLMFPAPSTLDMTIMLLGPVGWWYQNLLTFDRVYSETLSHIIDLKQRRVSPSTCQDAEKRFKTASVMSDGYLGQKFLPAYVRTAESAARLQTAVDQAVIACALERYRLAKGTFPEKLRGLVPEFLAKIPTDIITGEPLHYRREGDRFKLWSVGWNATDDGGKVAVTGDKNQQWDYHKGDWVWEYPSPSR